MLIDLYDDTNGEGRLRDLNIKHSLQQKPKKMSLGSNKADHGQKWMLEAPVFIVTFADMSCRIKELDGFVAGEAESAFELKQVIRDSANEAR